VKITKPANKGSEASCPCGASCKSKATVETFIDKIQVGIRTLLVRTDSYNANLAHVGMRY